GILRWYILARDLAMTRLGVNHGALPAPLWNRGDFHTVSGTCVLRCRFTRPQLGRCSNDGKSRASAASSIIFPRASEQIPLFSAWVTAGGEDFTQGGQLFWCV